MNRITARLLTLAAAALPLSAMAHTGHGATDSFIHGLAHPVGGLDHLLAMLAVGLWAAQQRGHATWTLPLSFVGVMALGAALAVAGVGLPGVELGIVGSVVAFGALLALGRRVPLVLTASLTGLFAVFHGFAHGAEMAAGSSPAMYGLGFVLATAGLHAAGLGGGLLTRRLSERLAAPAIRLGGVAVAAMGAVLLAG